MNEYTCLVNIMGAVIVIGLKAENTEGVRSLVTEYFNKLGYYDAEITSIKEGLISIEELQNIQDVVEAIPPKRFEGDLKKLRRLLGNDTLPDYKEDFETAKSLNKESDDLPLPEWRPTEDDKIMFMKCGISYK